MITKKCSADIALNTMIALQLQAKLLMYIHVYQIFLLMYWRYSSLPIAINSLTQPDLLRLAQDLTVTPASQAYYEQIFCIYGELTAGRRNQLIKTLYMRLSLVNLNGEKWPICEAITSMVLSPNCCFLVCLYIWYIIIPLCRKVLVAYSLLFLLNIGAVSDKRVCETIYTTASFQVCTFCSKCAIWNTCFEDELNIIRLKNN